MTIMAMLVHFITPRKKKSRPKNNATEQQTWKTENKNLRGVAAQDLISFQDGAKFGPPRMSRQRDS